MTSDGKCAVSSPWDERAPACQIVATAVVAAVVYGVLHDQVTARVCVEYFTIGHPPVFATSDPTLLGLGWGVIATWWVGLLLGVPLALIARCGSWPKTPPSALWKPIAILLLCMGACACIAGVLGFNAARSGLVALVEPLASRVPQEKHHAFIADLWAHLASYGSGFLGGAVVIGLVGWRRYRRAQAAPGALAADAREGEAPAPSLGALPAWTRTALGVAAQLVFLPQLVLLWVAALLGLASLAPPDRATVLVARLMSGVLAAAVIALGLIAWRRHRLVPRVLTVTLAFPAVWLCLVCVGRLV